MLALIDPKRAEEHFEADLATLEDQPEVDRRASGLVKMPEILTVPRDRRETLLRRNPGAFIKRWTGE